MAAGPGYSAPVNSEHQGGVVGGRLLVASGIFLFLGMAGCGYQTESERAYFDAKESERLTQLEQRNALVAVVPDKDILEMVQEEAAPDGEGTVKDWVGRQANLTSGQVLFPRWQVMRRGANRYEVRFTYTLIDATNHLTRLGQTWNVDHALKIVGKPQALKLGDPQPQGRSFIQQQSRRIREEEDSLE